MLRSHRTFAATVNLPPAHQPRISNRRRLDVPDEVAPRELRHLRQAVLRSVAEGLAEHLNLHRFDAIRLPDPRDVSPATHRHVTYWLQRQLRLNAAHRGYRRAELEALLHYWAPTTRQTHNPTR